jgi:LacI family transcriptional regulator
MKSHQTNSLKGIAKKFGVSVSTVSRVLSGQAEKYRIGAETAKTIAEFARKENFTPNPIAKGLRLRKTNTIGLVIADVINPFFAGIASEIANATRNLGYSLILSDSKGDLTLEKQAVELLWRRQVDGMIVCPASESFEHLARYAKERRPLVLVDQVSPEIGLPYVTSDNFAAGKMATAHLLEYGHKRIACLQGRPTTITSRLRVQGYAAALARLGIAFDPAIVVGDSFDEQGGYLDTKLLLQSGRDVTAILALSDPLALGALRALAEAGRRVPEDISIVAFDDQPYMAHLAAPLTAIAQASLEMGAAAVKILVERMRAPDAVTTGGGVLLPVSLIPRKSVRRM